MKRPRCNSRVRSLILLGATLLLGSALSSGRDGEKLTAKELIHRHLASIASPDQLKARQAFAVQGDCEYRLLLGGVLNAPGTAQLVSKGRAYNILFNFAAGEYAGTQFITDGKKTDIEYTSGGQVNPLWIFLQGQSALLTEGLLGGELTTAWALLDVDGRKPTLKYRGIDEVDGRRLHRLDYGIRKGGLDLKTRLYFEPETYHHVLSTYEVTTFAPMGSSPDASSKQRVARQRVEERFDEFKNLEGFMLPTSWTVQYFKTANDAAAMVTSPGLAGRIADMAPPVRTLNVAPGTAGAPGAALNANVDTATFLLQWKTTIRRSARNGEIPPEKLASLLKID